MPRLEREQMMQEVEQGRLRPAYTLFGPEEYSKREAVQCVRQKAVEAALAPLNCSDSSAQGGSIREALEFARTFPFGGGRRLVILRDAEALALKKNEEESAALQDYLKRPSVKSVLLLLAADLDRRTTLFRSLEANTCLVEFPAMRDREAEGWVERHVQKQGGRIARAAAQKLVALVGTDAGTLAAEIDRLTLLAGAGRAITEGMLDQTVRESRHHRIFDLTDALGRRDRARALALLARLLEEGEESLGIAAMIARHLRQLLIGKELLEAGRSEAEIGSAAQVPPFVRREFLSQVRMFDWPTLRAAYQRMGVLDLRLKSSASNPQTLLEHLICSF